MKKKVLVICLSLFAAKLFALGCNNVADIKQADQRWAQTMATHNAEKVVDLYAPDAVLVATYENKPITSEKLRIAYFKKLFKNLPELTVTYNQELINVFSNGGTSSGLYTFNGIKEGKPVSIPARFTFVYKAKGTGCEIITHHSSVLPTK